MESTLPETGPPDGSRSMRVRVWFGSHIICNYRAEPIAAQRYAAAMARRFAGLRVTVDREGADELRPLPCEQLWTLAP